MTTKLKINVALIDLESTCNDEPQFEKGEHEIIEIGLVICELSLNGFNELDQLQLHVRPVINSELTNFCVELTGVTQKMVDGSTDLSKTLPILKIMLDRYKIKGWCSWGKSDCSQFENECEMKSLANPLMNILHVNLKQIFARKFGHRVGLKRALLLRGMDFVGRHHSGIDDAKNIARLLIEEQILREAILKKIS